MSYINITEVDSTVQNLSAATNNNIAFVPLNSSDGPSGSYILMSDYTTFTQTFGIDPNPNSTIMTSWDYAANLLQRNMPVLVRRITSVIDADGNDTDTLLSGVSTAKALLKIPEVTGMAEEAAVPIPTERAFKSSTVTLDQSTLKNDTFNNIQFINGVNASKNTLNVGLGTGADGSIQNIFQREMDQSANKPVSGNIEIANDGASVMKLYSLIVQRSDVNGNGGKDVTIYDLGLSTITEEPTESTSAHITYENADGSAVDLVLYDNTGNTVALDKIEVKWDSTNNKAYIEFPIDYTFAYKSELSNCKLFMQLIPTTDGSLNVKTLVSPYGCTETLLTAENSLNEPIIGYTYALPITAEENFDDAQPFDNNGNLNLFKVYYRYPGTNGSRFSVGIKTIQGDGIYLQVWNNSQRLENVQLASFRYRNANGYYTTYDIYQDKATIWALFMRNFGVTIPVTTDQSNIVTTPLTTTYCSVEINPTLDFNCIDYLDSIYMQRGTVLSPLTGGSNPSDSDVIHEVNKVYSPLKDKYLYDVKFITNGGFVDELTYSSDITQIPSLKRRYIEESMVDLAQSRGDCLAFLDVPFELDKSDVLEYFQHLSTSYATAYAPWVLFNLLTGTQKWCPPSFAALWTIARSVNRGNPVYAPPAGVNRANLSEAVDLGFQIPSEYIDTWQDNYVQFVNPIVYINGYGINIFGQRTLYSRVDASYDNSSALQYLNVRLVANEIKKQIFNTCIELTFEYNNLRTWLSFKSKMQPLLDTLLYNNHITDYEIIMDQSTMTDADIRSGRVIGTVRVAVASTAEKFDITFELMPNQVTFLGIDYDTDNVTDQYGSPY